MVKLFFVGSIPIICFYPQSIINHKRADLYKVGDKLFTKDKRELTIIDIFHVPHLVREPYVQFYPNCFAPGIPEQSVIVTPYHSIKYNGKLKFAIRWLNEDKIGKLFYDNNNSSIHFLVNSPTVNEFINCNNLEVDVMGLNNKYLQWIGRNNS